MFILLFLVRAIFAFPMGGISMGCNALPVYDFSGVYSLSDCDALARSECSDEKYDCVSECRSEWVDKCQDHLSNLNSRNTRSSNRRTTVSDSSFYPDELTPNYGKEVLNDGTVLEGIFLRRQLVSGTVTKKNGWKAEGEWEPYGNVIRLVKGKVIHETGKIEEGDFVNAKLVKGKVIHENGKIEEGDFVNGYLVKGKVTLQDGSIAEGEFVEGSFVKGKLTTADGIISECEFVDGNLVISKVIYENGKIEEGEFVNGYLVKGKATLQDGTIYEGDFANGNFVKGKAYRKNGDIEIGTYTSDQKLTGKIIKQNGEIQEYENGELKSMFSCSSTFSPLSWMILLLPIIGLQTIRK